MTANGRYVRLVSPDKESPEAQTEPVIQKSVAMCNATRFTIATLSLLIATLLVTIVFIVRRPHAQPSSLECQSADGSSHSNTNILSVSGDTFQIGIITDIHLMVHPDDCDGNLGWEYGGFGCDSTEALLNTTLSVMQDKLSTQSIVFMLGDAAQHQNSATWNTNITIAAIHTVYAHLASTFPHTPVFPTIGNNDLEKHNTIPDSSWYETLLPMFETALRGGERVTLPPDFRDTFRRGGYYSATLTGGLTVISLNTNLVASKTQGLRVGADPQLEWLERELEMAEKRVAIIGHHPPMLSLYALRYNVLKNHWDEAYVGKFFDICRKYQEKIMGIFAGHEHQDSFSVEKMNGVDISAFSLPSVSPVYQGQPSFSMATITNNHELVDIRAHHTWLDFYNRLGKEPVFSSNISLSQILGLRGELDSTAMLNSAGNIIREEDRMQTYIGLRDKVYQNRLGVDIAPFKFYCYTTNFRVDHFKSCIEQFGIDSSVYDSKNVKEGRNGNDK